ncbi:phosphodiester glycosidase family protein [Heliobacterium chlorum]|uniref:Phosphodiester glycosidase family protein n=1 Tax=Heliobacterium chlorum TaxID=2698 RepID=A0ABR7SWD8_HELCL|nr:phosphodiester glycosidase family protein [Heliobacterium chlorum]MBC9782899.1 phosphodiester glycosidase family protein [Heliobacterium chlorum]
MKFVKMLALFIGVNLMVGIFFGPLMIFYGPIPSLRQMALGSLMVSRHDFIAQWFLSPEKIQEILGQPLEDLRSNPNMGVQLAFANGKGSDRIEVEDIQGKRFTGKVMIIHDPKRVKVALSSKMGEAGETVPEIATHEGAVAAINGGGFIDPNGQGNGAYPDGVTVSKGQFISVIQEDQKENIVGLTKKGILIVGRYSARELRNMDVSDVVTFGPALVINGKPTITQGDGGYGIAPRTAIGQKADGSIIFMTIDGRQVGSIGATLREVQDLMIQYGAVTSGNLDGGASTTMVYNGKVINQPSSVFGIRYIPTAFVVMPSKRI